MRKARSLMVSIALCLCSTARAQSTVEEWKAAAIAKYPDLVVEGSAFNKAFVAKYEQAKVSSPAMLQEIDWPMKIANLVQFDALTEGQKSDSSNIPPPTTKPVVNTQELEAKNTGLQLLSEYMDLNAKYINAVQEGLIAKHAGDRRSAEECLSETRRLSGLMHQKVDSIKAAEKLMNPSDKAQIYQLANGVAEFITKHLKTMAVAEDDANAAPHQKTQDEAVRERFDQLTAARQARNTPAGNVPYTIQDRADAERMKYEFQRMKDKVFQMTK